MKGAVPKKLAGQFHGLVLQLLGAGILELAVASTESKNIGLDKLLSKHIVMKLGMRATQTGVDGLAILQPEAWDGITYH